MVPLSVFLDGETVNSSTGMKQHTYAAYWQVWCEDKQFRCLNLTSYLNILELFAEQMSLIQFYLCSTKSQQWLFVCVCVYI